ncbi:MAG: hypothetical protein JXQ76_00970 [Campylobacterales bacterium]|nr:hypothetical protein [Campylobacterales bacterium]
MFVRFTLLLLLFMTFLNASTPFEKSITPSKVYTKLMELHAQVHLIKEHFGLKGEPSFRTIKSQLQPRHAWQRTYEIFIKINILRQKYHLPAIKPVNMQPTLNLSPSLTYEQVLRLLQEVKILKLHLGISQEVGVVEEYTNQTPTDVYNILNTISRDFDLINAQEFTPSYVFGELIRIYEDFQVIFNHFKIDDQTTPPSKNSHATPLDSYRIGLELLSVLAQIEKSMGLESIDFYAFRRNEVTASDVFEITQIILAEIQMIKANIGLEGIITQGAKNYSGKRDADVAQIMGWLLKKSQKLLNNQKLR